MMNRNDGAFAHGALDTKAETVLLEDGLGDGKAQAGALLACVGAGAVVAVEDIGQVLRRDAGAMVFHFHPDALGAFECPQEEKPVLSDVVHGVAQQVVQGPLHHVGVGVNGKLLFGQLQLELPAVLGADGVVTLADLVAELAHIKMHPLALDGTAGHLAQFHHAGDEGCQPVGFVHDNIHLLVAVGLVVARDVPHRLGVALDEGQRGAQVVGDIGQQVPLHLGGMLDFLRHVVEVLCQIAQFVVPLGVHLHVVIALGHLPGRAGKFPQGLGEPLAEQPGRRHGERKDQCRRQRQHGAHHPAGLRDMHQAGGHQHRIAAIGGRFAHHQLDRAGGRGRVDLPHTAARLPAELPHGAGRAVGEHFAAGVRGLGAVEIAVRKGFRS